MDIASTCAAPPPARELFAELDALPLAKARSLNEALLAALPEGLDAFGLDKAKPSAFLEKAIGRAALLDAAAGTSDFMVGFCLPLTLRDAALAWLEKEAAQ